MRQLSGGCRPQKYLADVCPSNIWGVYTPRIFDGCMSVKYLTHAHAQLSRGYRPPKYLTDIHPSNVWGVYTPNYLTDACPSNV